MSMLFLKVRSTAYTYHHITSLRKDCMNADGRTALEVAMLAKNWDGVRLLVAELKADVNRPLSGGKHKVAYWGKM